MANDAAFPPSTLVASSDDHVLISPTLMVGAVWGTNGMWTRCILVTNVAVMGRY